MEVTDTNVSEAMTNATLGTTPIPYNNLAEYRTAMTVRVVALAIIVPLATFGNVLSCIVMCRKNLRRSTTSLYLTFLCCIDLAVIYFACIPESVAKLTGHFLENSSDAMCKWSFFNTHLTRQLSSWVLVLVSVERVIAVYLPLKSKKLCSRKVGVVSLIVTTFILVIISGRLFFTRYLTEDNQCKAPKHLVYFAVKISPWIIKVFYWMAPAIIMIITNALIFVKLRLIALKSSDESAKKITGNTITIIVATTAFIITTSPLVLFFILNPGWNIQPAEIKVTYELRYAFFQTLAYMNHAINFLLYVASGPKFRRELVSVLTRRSVRVSPDTGTLTRTAAVTATKEVSHQVRVST